MIQTPCPTPKVKTEPARQLKGASVHVLDARGLIQSLALCGPPEPLGLILASALGIAPEYSQVWLQIKW